MKKFNFAVAVSAVFLSIVSVVSAQNVSPTRQEIIIGGIPVTPPVYSINDSNYFRLRDIAESLDFNVAYSSETNSVEINTSLPYYTNGSESVTAVESEAFPSEQALYINGEEQNLSAYLINDSNYFRLRDIAAALDFGCIYNSDADRIEIDRTYSYSPDNVWGNSKLSGILTVNFIDVGQGDSEFIELPNGKTMLIDAGEAEYGQTVSDYISSNGISSIDYVIATHPHSDHIGGMAEVINNFDINTMYMPKISNNTKTFENLLQTISDKGLAISEAKSGVSIFHNDVIDIRIIAPYNNYYEDLNNYSAVIKLTYGKNSFLLMGDAEEESENEIATDISSDVVKVGHHGSNSSSSMQFISRTGAKYAVISVGESNSYGHPTQKTLTAWETAGADVLRTDLFGNIVFTSDGKELSYTTSKSRSDVSADTDNNIPQSDVYILNTNTKKIHLPSCRYAKSISQENYEKSSESLSELINQGYVPCKVCNP